LKGILTYVHKQRAGQKEYGNKSVHEESAALPTNLKMTV
jgi:hypothetical protein